MVDVAGYLKQGTMCISGCAENSLESIIGLFLEACQNFCAEQGLNVTVHLEEFKTDSPTRKFGGMIGLAAKLAQKPTPGFTIESQEDNYRIHLVAGQYRDEISFDTYFFTGFNLYKDSNSRKFQYSVNKFELTLECMQEAFQSITDE